MIASPVFVDTGPLIARYLIKDQYHEEAVSGWQGLEKSSRRLSTSNFVLDETFTLLARRSSHAFAAQRARSLMTSQVLEILRPTVDDECRALDVFEKYSDQKVSFTDCISFVLMQRHGLHHAFTFDRHFSLAGFEIWSGEASFVHEPETVYDP